MFRVSQTIKKEKIRERNKSMRILYLECQMGAAGDMIMSALYELLEKE